MGGLIFEWWGWAAAAMALAILEVLAPGSIFLGFAIGAGCVAILLAVGGAGLVGGSIPWILVIFACVSLVAWLILRRVFRLRKGDVKVWTTDIND